MGLAVAADEALPPEALKRRPKRVLLFHMGGVLGHLHRVLALAEEIDAAGHEAVIATSDGALPLMQALRPGVRQVPAYDDPHFKTARSSIASTMAGRRGDLLNLRGMGPQEQQSKAGLAHLMERMAAADRALIESVRPDAIVMDHRFTASSVLRDYADRIFFISNLVGLPSLHQRVTGRLPYPLEEVRILVPGVRQIECWRRKLPPRRIEFCGLFRWQGWARLRGTQAALPPAEVLYCFGSTGEPVLRRAGAEGFSARWVGEQWRGVAGEPAVDLERGLASAGMLICHGGHGTVMQALLHGRPVIVLPSNPEQFEIGRRLEAMRLGLLVRERFDTLSQAGLAGLVARVRGDTTMHRRVEQYAALLRKNADGARHAAAIVLAHADAENL